jgi:hypothetical protein
MKYISAIVSGFLAAIFSGLGALGGYLAPAFMLIALTLWLFCIVLVVRAAKP